MIILNYNIGIKTNNHNDANVQHIQNDWRQQDT